MSTAAGPLLACVAAAVLWVLCKPLWRTLAEREIRLWLRRDSRNRPEADLSTH